MENLNKNDGRKSDMPFFEEHSLLESAVTEASREHQVSRGMAMMCALGAIATACQRLVDVRMPTGHQVPTSLMLLSIAESGERKTSTQNYFFEAIKKHNNLAFEQHESQLAKHRVQHQLWAAKKRLLERAYGKNANQGDEAGTQQALIELEKHINEEPKSPKSDKFVYDDTTPQALVQMLYENSKNGCLLTSEANSIFSGKALGELDKLNTLWDGGDVIVDRLTRESFILKDARFSLCLMAQPSVINSFMSRRGDEARGTGFLARFLVQEPTPMAGKRSPTKHTGLTKQKAFNDRITDLLNSRILPNRQVLELSEMAKGKWTEYSVQLENEMQENMLYHYAKDHASKLLENVTRLAAIIHTFENDIEKNKDISLSTLEFSWHVARTCSQHFTRRLAGEPQLITDTNHLVQYLLRRLEDKAYPKRPHDEYHQAPPSSGLKNKLMRGISTDFTLTEIKQLGPYRLRGRINSERLEAAVTLLMKLGHVEKAGAYYRFSDSIFASRGLAGPQMRNGEIITIKTLALFSEQYYQSDGHYSDRGYYLIVD